MKNLHSNAKSRHQNHATLSVVLYVIAAFIAVFAVYTTFAAGSNLIAYASIQGQDVSFLTDIVPAVFQQSFPMYAYALIFLTFGKTYDKVFAVYNKTFHLESSTTKETVTPEESKPENSEPEEAKAEAQEEIVSEESTEEEVVQDFVERCTEEESGEAAEEEEISDEESETTKNEASTEKSEKNEESKEEKSENKSKEELEEPKKAEESDSNKEDSSKVE